MTRLQIRRKLARGGTIRDEAKAANREVRDATDKLAKHVIDLRAMVEPINQDPIDTIIDNIHELLRVSWRIEAQLHQRIEHLLALAPEEDA